jgi:hypothetical protein
LEYFDQYPAYSAFKNGRTNLYRLFMLRGVSQMGKRRYLSFIVPMAILGDDFSLLVRRSLLENHALRKVEAFPQKDDPRRRVFPDAKLSTTVIAIQQGVGDTALSMVVRTHPGKDIELSSPAYECTPSELLALFPRHPKIPTVSHAEFELMRKVEKRDWPALADVAHVYVGEVFDNAPNKKYLTDTPPGLLVARGANVDRYRYRAQSSQGAPRYLRVADFTRDKARSEKFNYLKQSRVGIQRGAAVDMWRRLIACVVPAGQFSFDTVLLLAPETIDIRVALGLVNSDLWEWLFRCTSATNHVNEYDLADFRVPAFLTDVSDPRTRLVIELVDECLTSQDVRRTDERDLSANSPDRRLDKEIYSIYEIEEAEQAVIRHRLDGK